MKNLIEILKKIWDKKYRKNEKREEVFFASRGYLTGLMIFCALVLFMVGYNFPEVAVIVSIILLVTLAVIAAIISLKNILISYVHIPDMYEITGRETQNHLSRFEERIPMTEYMEHGSSFDQLNHFLMSKNNGLSWWVISGVSGIGKKRLVSEVLLQIDKLFVGDDVLWLEGIDDYGEDTLRTLIDTIIGDEDRETLLIANNAQIHLDSIRLLIEYIYSRQKTYSSSFNIRLLLLVRTGEDEKSEIDFLQFISKLEQDTLKNTLFNEFEYALRLNKYNTVEIGRIIESYTSFYMERQKDSSDTEQIPDLKNKVFHILQSENVDQNHLRPLYAMIITDAILQGKEPKKWCMESLLSYAAKVCESDCLKNKVISHEKQSPIGLKLDEEVLYGYNAKIIICMSIIKYGITLSEIEKIVALNKENQSNFKRDYIENLLGVTIETEDDIIRVKMPDIIEEYYVLNELVIHSDAEDVRFKCVIQWLIDSMHYAESFRQRVRQNFQYIYKNIENDLDEFYSAFFDQCSSRRAMIIIMKLLDGMDLKDSNAIIIHWAIGNLLRHNADLKSIANMLLNTLYNAPQYADKRVCLYELKHLTEENSENIDNLIKYSIALSYMINCAFSLEEKREFLHELRQLKEEHEENLNIMLGYCMGLIYIAESDREYIDGYRAELHGLMTNKKFVQYATRDPLNIVAKTQAHDLKSFIRDYY